MTDENQLQLHTDVFEKGSTILRAINHPLRQKIMKLIHQNGKMAVTDIYVKMKLEQSVASQHLSILRKEGFVISERDQRFIFYSLNYQRINEVQVKTKELAELLKGRNSIYPF